MFVLIVTILVIGSQIGCATEPEYALRPGVIDFYGDGPEFYVDAVASVRRPGTVRVVTIGNGCHRKGEVKVDIEGLVATVEPYDSVCVGCSVCNDIGLSFTYIAKLPFPEPGVATVRIRGLVAPGDTVRTVQTAMVIH